MTRMGSFLCIVMCSLGIVIILENSLGHWHALIAGLSVFFGLSVIVLILHEITDLLEKLERWERARWRQR